MSRDGTTSHSIRLRYQIVNAAQSVIGAGTPPMSLRILGPDGDLPVVIPAWGFTFGPVVTPENRIAGHRPNLRPALPRRLSTPARAPCGSQRSDCSRWR